MSSYLSALVLVGLAGTVLAIKMRRESALAAERERLRAEAVERAVELEFQRERWQATVDNMLDLVIVCDADGIVVYVNPAYTRLINRFAEPGLPLSEHPRFYQIFRPDGTMFEPEDLPLQRAALQDRQVKDVGIVHRLPDGKELVCVFSASPLHDEGGRVVGAVAVGRDITQRRLAEAERERLLLETKHRAQELAAANKELESFSYSVSHDLRAPLRRIDGFSAALLDEYADSLDERGKDYLNRVRGGSQRMSQLIDDMLRLSRVTLDEMRREEVNLSELVGSIAANLREDHPERNVDFIIKPGLIVQGDARLLGILLANLISNAWKFTSRIPEAKIEFGDVEQEGQRAYYVRDNGAGFDPAYAGKLFIPFQRLHSDAEFPGTGIGLATVQRIVGRHGGRVWAEGEGGRGATFYFSLG